MVNLSKLFPKKELSDKEKLEREYKKKIKKLKWKVLTKPKLIKDNLKELEELLNNMVSDDIISEDEKNKHLERMSKDLNKGMRISDKFRR